MITYPRQVHFHEVDAAGLVFFPHFLTWAHEAMEQLFAGLDGGYAGLITARRIGLPAVRVDSQFFSPVLFGEHVEIETTVARLGTRSMDLRYRFRRRSDGVVAAEVRHTVVSTDLVRVVSTDMPADVRAVAEQHLEAPE
jgi:4-hydroxybenzoyl-CoA thioesterase